MQLVKLQAQELIVEPSRIEPSEAEPSRVESNKEWPIDTLQT